MSSVNPTLPVPAGLRGWGCGGQWRQLPSGPHHPGSCGDKAWAAPLNMGTCSLSSPHNCPAQGTAHLVCLGEPNRCRAMPRPLLPPPPHPQKLSLTFTSEVNLGPLGAICRGSTFSSRDRVGDLLRGQHLPGASACTSPSGISLTPRAVEPDGLDLNFRSSVCYTLGQITQPSQP